MLARRADHGSRHAGDMTPRYAVAWAPEEPGPFPLFAGELQVENAEDYDAFWLVLRGAYEPPLGLVGAAFDYIVGSRIAATCARNLLTEIAESIENAKSGRSRPAILSTASDHSFFCAALNTPFSAHCESSRQPRSRSRGPQRLFRTRACSRRIPSHPWTSLAHRRSRSGWCTPTAAS